MNAAELSLGLQLAVKLIAIFFVLAGLWKVWSINRKYSAKYSRAEVSLALNCIKKMPDTIKEPDLSYFKAQRRVIIALILFATALLVFGNTLVQLILSVTK